MPLSFKSVPYLLTTSACAFLFSQASQAAVQVAFLQVRDHSGRVVVFEPGGRYTHIAVSYRGGWLHAHPATGVEWTPSLRRFGAVVRIIENPGIQELPESLVKRFLGRPYDKNWSWDDQAIYCSELIAKLLRVPARPMSIDASRIGISPEEVDDFLSAQPKWKVVCEGGCRRVSQLWTLSRRRP